jgi:hypothetical protein
VGVQNETLIEYRLHLQHRFDNKLENSKTVWECIFKYMKSRFPNHRFSAYKSLETSFNARAVAQRCVPTAHSHTAHSHTATQHTATQPHSTQPHSHTAAQHTATQHTATQPHRHTA